MRNKKIIIATNNLGKAKEFEKLFDKYGISIETLHDYPELPEVEETGVTFKENAFKKANEISQILGQVVLADDSGLEVDALNGAPGVYSARYAGEPANDENNNNKLLQDLKSVPNTNRAAQFHCSLALVGPDREPLHVEGKVKGFILREPKGNNGFGYDPLFYIPELDQTMAELSDEEKNEVSHRAQAIKQLEKHLKDWL
jgi:XTP/dITP diphosphohydrolase